MEDCEDSKQITAWQADSSPREGRSRTSIEEGTDQHCSEDLVEAVSSSLIRSQAAGSIVPAAIPFIYDYERSSGKLFRTDLSTAARSYLCRTSYSFINGIRWSELPGGQLFITGWRSVITGLGSTKEVVKIDTFREFAFSDQPRMCTARFAHGAVYHAQRLYVLGGLQNNVILKECERLEVGESSWESLPPLLKACYDLSGVGEGDSLYALGGKSSSQLDCIQKLTLRSLTWELMQVQLPFAGCSILSFRTDTQIYLVMQRALYSFIPLLAVKPLSCGITSYGGTCSYFRGQLYYLDVAGAVKVLSLGTLS
jgi:hypothetical protein